MITFVGAGPGAEDLITVRGQNKLKEADVVIYAGSLVNPALLKMCREECEIYNKCRDDTGRSNGGHDQRREFGEKGRASAYGRIPVCMVQSKNRWMNWTDGRFHLKTVRESVLFVGRSSIESRIHSARYFPSQWLLQGWQEEHLYRKKNQSEVSRHIRRPWYYS